MADDSRDDAQGTGTAPGNSAQAPGAAPSTAHYQNRAAVPRMGQAPENPML